MGRGTHLGEFEEIVLLAVARLRRGGHGAAIHEAILEATGRDVSIAAVYVTLTRLQKKGLVTAAAELGSEGGRPRKTFSLTPHAIRELQDSRVVRDRLWSGLSFDPVASERES